MQSVLWAISATTWGLPDMEGVNGASRFEIDPIALPDDATSWPIITLDRTDCFRSQRHDRFYITAFTTQPLWKNRE